MLNYYHQATIKDGKLIYDKPDMLELDLRNKNNKRVRILIEEIRPEMSEKSRNYYYAILKYEATQTHEFIGMSIDEIHNVLFRHFHGSLLKDTVTSFKSLTDTEFYQYLDDVIDFLTDLGVSIKTPQEYKQLRLWNGKK